MKRKRKRKRPLKYISSIWEEILLSSFVFTEKETMSHNIYRIVGFVTSGIEAIRTKIKIDIPNNVRTPRSSLLETTADRLMTELMDTYLKGHMVPNSEIAVGYFTNYVEEYGRKNIQWLYEHEIGKAAQRLIDAKRK